MGDTDNNKPSIQMIQKQKIPIFVIQTILEIRYRHNKVKDTKIIVYQGQRVPCLMSRMGVGDQKQEQVILPNDLKA